MRFISNLIFRILAVIIFVIAWNLLGGAVEPIGYVLNHYVGFDTTWVPAAAQLLRLFLSSICASLVWNRRNYTSLGGGHIETYTIYDVYKVRGDWEMANALSRHYGYSVTPLDIPTYTVVSVNEVNGQLNFEGDLTLRPGDTIKVRVWTKGEKITHYEYLHSI